MVQAKGQRLDFMVLNHDDDLIGVLVFDQRAAVRPMQHQKAAISGTTALLATFVADEEETLQAKVVLLAKPDVPPSIATKRAQVTPASK